MGVIKRTGTIPDSPSVTAGLNHITSSSLPRAVARSFPGQSVVSFHYERIEPGGVSNDPPPPPGIFVA